MLGIFVAVAAALLYLVEEEGQGQLENLDPAVVSITGIKMVPAYADSFRATGTIVNHSEDHDITELSIRFSVNDCDSAEADANCTTLSQVVEPVRLHVPAAGSAGFEESVSPRRVKVSGVRRWTFKVTEVKGRVPLRRRDE